MKNKKMLVKNRKLLTEIGCQGKMTSFFNFKSGIEIEIRLEDVDENNEEEVIYYDGQSIKGNVILRLKDNKPVKHDGIKLEFIGQIQLFQDSHKGNHHQFLNLLQELQSPQELSNKSYNFNFTFKSVEKQFESYNGINVKLR
jgi:vacuolar protein sorting-associated protein 26